MRERVEQFSNQFQRLREEIGKVIVGQDELVYQVLLGLVAGGHILLEGVPGLGKTLLVKTLGQCLELEFSRAQFTPDLMPADILGTQVIETAQDGARSFRFHRGPIFTNLLLGDEINRATPKTQSALLEAMQERQVTVAGEVHPLPEPFFVLATQNPIEMEGTYPLPEAQVDRFFFKVLVRFPNLAEMNQILDRTTGSAQPEVKPVCRREDLLEMQRLARDVVVSETVRDYVARIVLATHPELPEATASVKKYLRYGSSPRGAQSLLLAAKARALTEGRFNVAFEDVELVAVPCLRHRIIPSFEAEAEGVACETILRGLLESLKIEVSR